MKNRKLLIVMYLIFTIFFTFSLVYANEGGLGKGFDYSVVPKDGEAIFSSQANKIWNSAVTVIRIATFIGIFLVGLRYMFASADQRAELKKNSIALVLGMLLVFASTLVINFVVNVFNQLK